MGEEDLLGQKKSALELSQHQSEGVGGELRLPIPQARYPHPCSPKPELSLGVGIIKFCGSALVCVIRCLCTGHSEVKLGLYDWAAPEHLSPNTDLQLFFPAWISCIRLCIFPGCACRCRLCQHLGICLLDRALNTPWLGSSLLQCVIFALAAMPHLVLDHTDNW